jgi:hypothetical protein
MGHPFDREFLFQLQRLNPQLLPGDELEVESAAPLTAQREVL